jgi:WD40 repeat protein
VVSARVAEIVEGEMKGMFWGKLKGIAIAVLLGGALAAGAGAVALRGSAPQAGKPQKQHPPVAKGDEDANHGEGRKAIDRFGDPLPEGALARMGTVRFHPGGTPSRLAFSPDGKLMVSAFFDNGVRVWEATTGKEVLRLPDRGPLGQCFVGFFDDGKAIGTLSQPVALRLWDLRSGKQRRVVPIVWRSYAVTSADGKMLATAHFKGKVVYLLDPVTGKERRQIPAGGVLALALSPDGKTVAAAGLDNRVRVWNTATGEELRKFDAPVTYRDGDKVVLAFSPDGKALAAALADKVIRLWDVPAGKKRGSLVGHKDRVRALAFSPDGKTLASGGRDNAIRLWELPSGKERRHMAGHYSGVESLVFAPDGRTLAAGSGGAVWLWDPVTGKEVRPLGGHAHLVLSAAFSPDGMILATGAGDGTIRLWRPATGEELRKIETGQDWVQSLTFSPDGKTIASAGWDRTVRLWEAATGKEMRRIEGHAGPVNEVAFSPDGKTLASAAEDQTVRLWDTATGKEAARLGGHKTGPTHVAFSPDGKRLATVDQAAAVRIWDCATHKELRRLHGRQSRMNAVAFSPDGKTLAAAGWVWAEKVEQWGDAILLWDVSTGKELRRFHRLPGQGKPKKDDRMNVQVAPINLNIGARSVLAIAFTPDGRSLISAEFDGTVVVWEVLTGLPRREFLGHQAYVHGLALSPDGRIAASASSDLTALVWDVTGLLGRKGRPLRLPPGRLGQLWEALRGQDAQKAARAQAALAAAPTQAVQLIRDKLLAVPPADRAKLHRLISDLDSEQFQTRKRAERQLARLGPAAGPALRKALERSPPLEQRRRLERLLRPLEARTAPAEAVTASRAVQILKWLGSPEARRLLKELARGAPGAWLTEEAAAACRRFTSSGDTGGVRRR